MSLLKSQVCCRSLFIHRPKNGSAMWDDILNYMGGSTASFSGRALPPTQSEDRI